MCYSTTSTKFQKSAMSVCAAIHKVVAENSSIYDQFQRYLKPSILIGQKVKLSSSDWPRATELYLLSDYEFVHIFAWPCDRVCHKKWIHWEPCSLFWFYDNIFSRLHHSVFLHVHIYIFSTFAFVKQKIVWSNQHKDPVSGTSCYFLLSQETTLPRSNLADLASKPDKSAWPGHC